MTKMMSSDMLSPMTFVTKRYTKRVVTLTGIGITSDRKCFDFNPIKLCFRNMTDFY